MWREVKRLIHSADHFLITTHLNPDGDGIGSAAALIELLLILGKKVEFVCDNQIPEKYQFLNFHGLFYSLAEYKMSSPVEVIFILDTYKEDRIGALAEFLRKPDICSICIDHHPSEKTLANVSVVDPQACSVGAMIYTLYKECGYDLNLFAAMGIYTSIISDTGRFSYASTTRKAHKLADECIKVGVDPSQMYAHLFQQVPLSQIRIFATALQRMEFFFEGKLVLQQVRIEDYLSHCHSEDMSLIQDFDYIHEFNKTIKGVECAAILWELPNKGVRISLRSNTGLDIIKPMKKIGGGGHPNAAGAFLHQPFEEVKKLLLELLAESFTFEPLKR